MGGFRTLCYVNVHIAYCLVLLDKYRFPREFSAFSAQWVLLTGFALTIVDVKCKCLCHQLGLGYFWISAILVAAKQGKLLRRRIFFSTIEGE